MTFKNIFQLLGRVDGIAAFAAEKVIDAVARDAAKPGPELVAFAQMAEVFPRGDEGFLCQILTLAKAAGGAVGQRTDQRLIARNNLTEGIAVSRQGPADQFSVVVDCA